MVKQKTPNFTGQRVSSPDDQPVRSTIVKRSTEDTLKPAHFRLTMEKLSVFAVMLLLLMMPIMYLLVLGPSGHKSLMTAKKDVTASQPRAARTAASTEPPAAPIIENALRHGGLDLSWADDSPPATRKPDPESDTRQKDVAAKKPFALATLSSRRKRVVQSEEKSVEKAPAGIQDASIAAVVAEPHPDIVVRTQRDSTDELIKRCRALGWIEGELCRIRICSDLWGTNPACATATSLDALAD